MLFGDNGPISAGDSVAVVCHDAGGANLVLSLLAHDKPNNLKAHLKGPALKIFNSFFSNLQQADSLNSALDGVDILVSGTGWATDLEHDARKLARSLGIKSVAVIDHWVNYSERFIRNDEEIHPDEIWVADSYAFNVVQESFPNIPVRQIRNHYLEDLVADIGTLSAVNPPEVLYILEPARSTWGKSIQGEFQALDFFKSKLDAFQLPPGTVIKLRPHPSDEIGKYRAWIAEQHDVAFVLEKKINLQESISRSSFVVGCESFALVIALLAGKRVYCSLPPWAPTCRLPHGGLIHLKNLE